MVRALVQRAFDASKMYFEFVGLSTDDKPKAGICTGSMSPVPGRGTRTRRIRLRVDD